MKPVVCKGNIFKRAFNCSCNGSRIHGRLVSGLFHAAPQAMYLNAQPSAGPVPNMKELKTLDAYYGWRRGEVKERKQ